MAQSRKGVEPIDKEGARFGFWIILGIVAIVIMALCNFIHK